MEPDYTIIKTWTTKIGIEARLTLLDNQPPHGKYINYWIKVSSSRIQGSQEEPDWLYPSYGDVGGNETLAMELAEQAALDHVTSCFIDEEVNCND